MKKLILFFIGILILNGIFALNENGCCVQDNFGNKCQNINLLVNNCDILNTRNVLCEQVQACQQKCCVFQETGDCDINTPKQECLDAGGNPNDDASCGTIDTCRKVCCVLNGQGVMYTSAQCSILEGMPNNGITTQAECETQAGEHNGEGACVYEDGFETKCKRLASRDECDLQMGSTSHSFREGVLCSHPDLNTICEKTKYTGCYGNNVYWFDSCDNAENIYEGWSSNARDKSWNNGFITSASESCSPGELNCGNCEQSKSSCGKKTKDTELWKTNDKQLTCIDWGCVSSENLKIPIYGVDASDLINEEVPDWVYASDGTRFENGEQWCLYDGFAGAGKDTVGSDHWVASCIQGNITITPAGTSFARDVICMDNLEVEGRKSVSLILNTNSLTDCSSITESTVQSGMDWTNVCQGDPRCTIISGKCTASVSLGNPDLSKEGITTYTESNCGKNSEIAFDWNCDWGSESGRKNCRGDKWSRERDNYCITLGDCGAYLNYIGIGSDSGGETTEGGGSPISGSVNSQNLYQKYTPEGGTTEEEYFKKYYNQLNIENYIPINFSLSFKGQKFLNIETPQFFNSTGGEEMSGKIGGGGMGLDMGGGNNPSGGTTFHCNAWQPPQGGSQCDLCNKDPLGRQCTEYRCKSLGTECEFFSNGAGTEQTQTEDGSINPGIGIKAVNNPYCKQVDCSMNDVTLPKMLEDSLVILPTEYKFEKDLSDNKIFNIKNSNSFSQNEIQEGNSISMIVTTDKSAKCKISFDFPDQSLTYAELTDNWITAYEGDVALLSHTFIIDRSSLIVSQLINAGKGILRSGNEIEHNRILDLTLYMVCENYCPSSTSNPTSDIFSPTQIKFQLKEGPDIQPVSSFIFNPESGSYIRYNQDKQEVKMWLNEPAECRYSLIPLVDYDSMNILNKFDCQTDSTSEQNSVDGYLCVTTFQNLNNSDNKFYIRCKDQPWEIDQTKRYANREDTEYILQGSESELKIDFVKPKEEERQTIDLFTSVDFEIQTSGGYDGTGTTTCSYYQDNYGWQEIYDENGESNYHKTTFSLGLGDNLIPIKCNDFAGNMAWDVGSIKLILDTSSPEVVRAYSNGGVLTVITNEDADCYYNNFDYCNPFDINNATLMEGGVGKVHTTSVDESKTYYIKCRDIFGKWNIDCGIIIKQF